MTCHMEYCLARERKFSLHVCEGSAAHQSYNPVAIEDYMAQFAGHRAIINDVQVSLIWSFCSDQGFDPQLVDFGIRAVTDRPNVDICPCCMR